MRGTIRDVVEPEANDGGPTDAQGMEFEQLQFRAITGDCSVYC
jgi:hypothetical protein